MKKEFEKIRKSKYFKYIVAFGIIKKVILLVMFLVPLLSFSQSYKDLMSISSVDMFKKAVIADNLAKFVSPVYDNPGNFDGGVLLVATLFFSFQIFCDFSGYSDMARGAARVMGFRLTLNFDRPYAATSLSDFWRRWHITLSTWLRDYVYEPVAMARRDKGIYGVVLALMLTFLISGLWHGANWTFVLWGALNALYILPLILGNLNRSNLEVVAHNSWYPTVKEVFQIVLTFLLTVLAWISFRSDDIGQAWQIYQDIFDKSLLSIPNEILSSKLYMVFLLIVFFVFIEWMGRNRHFAIENLFDNSPRIFRWLSYTFLCFLIGMFMSTKESAFIYFQF